MQLNTNIRKVIFRFADFCIVPIIRLINRIFSHPFNSIRRIGRYVYWSARLKEIGEESEILPQVIIHNPEKVSIGSNSKIGEFVLVWGGGGVIIGNDVLIAANVIITSQTHNVMTNSLFNLTHQERPIVIENNVWIGAGAIILPGVRIGSGSVVGAGSVVTQDIPTNTCVAGVPARKIKSLPQKVK